MARISNETFGSDFQTLCPSFLGITRKELKRFCSSGAMLIRSSHVSRHNSSRKTLTFCCLLCLLLPKKLTQSWTNERVTTYLMTSLSFRLWTKIDIDRLALGPELTMATFSCISFSLIFSLSFLLRRQIATFKIQGVSLKFKDVI